MRYKRTVMLVFLFFFCIHALSLAACGAVVFNPTRDISADVEHGIVCFAKGDVDGAINEFTASIRSNPKDYLAYYHRAKVYEFKEDSAQAIADYGQTIKAGCGYFLFGYASYYRGVLYQRMRNLPEAIGDYTAIINQSELSVSLRANAYNNRGLAYDRQGKFDDALADFNRALELIPKLLNAHYNRGVAYANLGAYAPAREDFLKELGLNPCSVNAHYYNVTLAYYEQGDYYRSWYHVFRLMRSDQHVSRLLIVDLKNKIEKASSRKTSGGVLTSTSR